MAKGFTTGFGPARCFLLKDARGHAGGMLRQSGGRLSCKAQADGAGEGRLALRFADGEERTLPLPLDGAERDWPDEGRAVEGAYVTADGRLLLATDERAREAYAREREREERRARRSGGGAPDAAREAETTRETRETKEAGKSEERERISPVKAKAQETAQAAGESARAEASAGGDASDAWDAPAVPDASDAWDAPAGRNAPLPEGRWPPPPCMPGARYRDGRWTEVSPSVR